MQSWLEPWNLGGAHSWLNEYIEQQLLRVGLLRLAAV